MLHDLLAAQHDCVAHCVWTSSHAPLTQEQRWHAATLTAPGRVLAGASAARSWGFADARRAERFVVVARDGRGTRRRHGDVLVWPQRALRTVEHRGIPTVVPERVLADLLPWLDDDALRRATLEALRVTPMTWEDLAREASRAPQRRGLHRLARLADQVRGLPIARCRSNAEAQALWRRRLEGRDDVEVNVIRGGFEADLVDDAAMVITEVDSAFHVDPELDARKDAAWRAAGYVVRRRPSDDAYREDARW